MKKKFSEVSYRGQVRRLRTLAERALSLYPLQVRSLHFIHHGENTTFRVEASRSHVYLLRVHRRDYHTLEAIAEEMAWLAQLSELGLHVPRPLASRNDRLVENVDRGDDLGSRPVSVLHWIHGHFLTKSLRPEHLFEVGQVLGLLHDAPKFPTRHRAYWTADGLVGKTPKFGSIDSLPGLKPKDQARITAARNWFHRRLKSFEERYPDRQRLIHSDLHFGNLVRGRDGFSAIDFDDCGRGFEAYDLVAPLLSVQANLGESRSDEWPYFRDALIAGYATQRPWDEADESLLEDLLSARRLLMLGWLNSRSDNPRLRAHLPAATAKALDHLRRLGF